jgi:hypothetical protein
VFDNVPAWLTEKIRGLPALQLPDRESVYLHAAGWVIARYLGKDVSSPNEDAFFDYREDTTGALWHGHVNRVISVGESLFVLRSSPGFPEFCRRLRQRNLRSAYFEMLAAKQSFKAGFAVHARFETGVKGEDFDFRAVRSGESVNVEVTALTAKTYSVNTVLNALGQKRKQIPATAAAVLYCVLPEEWLTGRLDWDFSLFHIANQFLAGTRRVNVIVFWLEEHMNMGAGKPGGALGLTRKAYGNAEPRIPLKDSSFLFAGEISRVDFHRAVTTGKGLERLLKDSYNSDFFKWVDHMAPPTQTVAT